MDDRTWVLPVVGQKVLMQLRDDIEGIWHPGQWGFFGGSVEPGEDILTGARREIVEEIGFTPSELHPLLKHDTPEYGPDAAVHSFACHLTVDCRELVLGEGMDYDLLSIADIRLGRKRSPRFEKAFPIIPRPFIEEVFLAALAAMGNL